MPARRPIVNARSLPRLGWLIAASTLVIALASPASAGPAIRTASTPPFSGVTVIGHNYTSASGCTARSSIPSTPTANSTNGTFFVDAYATSNNCGSGSVAASAQSYFQFVGFSFTAKSSHVVIEIVWNFSWAVRLSTSGPTGSLNYFNDSSSADVTVGDVLVNSTNGAYDFNYTGTANLQPFATGISSGNISRGLGFATHVGKATYTVTPGSNYTIVLQVSVGVSVSSNPAHVVTRAEGMLQGQIVSVIV